MCTTLPAGTFSVPYRAWAEATAGVEGPGADHEQCCGMILGTRRCQARLPVRQTASPLAGYKCQRAECNHVTCDACAVAVRDFVGARVLKVCQCRQCGRTDDDNESGSKDVGQGSFEAIGDKPFEMPWLQYLQDAQVSSAYEE